MKRFLACSGGGDRGIVLLGMIKELAKSFGIDSVKYDMMAGISSGSLIVCLLSMIDHNDFLNEIDRKVEIFANPRFKVVNTWFFGEVINFLDAVMFHESLYNSTPLKELIKEHFVLKDMKTPFVVGAYNKTLSRYETLPPTHETVLASCSLPIILPDVHIKKICPHTNKLVSYDYEDGAVKHMIPVKEIKSFINQNQGSPLHIDVLVCFPINDVHMFFKMLVPKDGNSLLRASRRSLADVMLNVMQTDLNELAKLMDVNFYDFISHPYNTYKNNNITLQIISPDSGWHSNFIHMDKENSLKLFQSGEDAVKNYLNNKV